MSSAQKSLLADTHHEILATLKRLEEAGDIAEEAVHFFREKVRQNGSNILSLYILDVTRPKMEDGEYRVKVHKELTLMKDFSQLVATPLLNHPPRNLTQDEVKLLFDELRDTGEQKDEQHS